MNDRNARRLAQRGIRWEQRQDGLFAVVTMRFPTIGMPPATYEGPEASVRLTSFCVGLLGGVRSGRKDAGKPADPVLEALFASPASGELEERAAIVAALEAFEAAIVAREREAGSAILGAATREARAGDVAAARAELLELVGAPEPQPGKGPPS